MRTLFSIVTAALLLAGCATPYQKIGFSGGYKETKLKENAFRVSFKGNRFTDRRMASDFALLRCAELTLEKGFRFFAIAGSQSVRDKNYEFAGVELLSVKNPRTYYTIYCFKDKPPFYLMWYEATYLARSLREKHGLAERSWAKGSGEKRRSTD